MMAKYVAVTRKKLCAAESNKNRLLDLYSRLTLKYNLEKEDLISSRLLHAVTSDDFGSLQKAIDEGEDINILVYGKCQLSLLQVAIHLNREHFAVYLVKKGANINAKDSVGITPLMEAVHKNMIELTELLLEKGANVNAQDKWFRSPLHFTLIQPLPLHYKELTIMLIRQGADINCRDMNANTPIHCVILNEMTPLAKVEMCKLMISEGADLSIADINGNCALHHAVTCVSVNLTRLLLSKDVPIDPVNIFGQTPLLMAFNHHIPFLCILLINKGASVDVSDWENNTLLHLLFRGEYDDPYRLMALLLRKLIYEGVDINKKNAEGNTALMLAIKHQKSVADIKLLIRKGADVNVQNNEGDTPLLLAFKSFHNRFSPASPKLSLVPEMLIKKGAKVNMQDNRGNTPLHIAYSRDFRQDIDLLLKAGADMNIQNSNGETPLHNAMSHLNSVTFSNLIQQKKINFDLNVQDINGNTPLHNAIMASSGSSFSSAIQWLVNNGARVDIKNIKNQTAYDFAERNPAIERIIVKHIIKMKIAGMPVGKSLRAFYGVIELKCPDDMELKYRRDMVLRCLREMEQIKATNINKNHTLDILFTNKKNPCYLVGSEDFIESIMNTPVLEEIFPLYAPLLRIQYKIAWKRLHLLSYAHSCLALCKEIIRLQKLPYEIMQIIFDYLENEDLKSLIKCMNKSRKKMRIKSSDIQFFYRPPSPCASNLASVSIWKMNN